MAVYESLYEKYKKLYADSAEHDAEVREARLLRTQQKLLEVLGETRSIRLIAYMRELEIASDKRRQAWMLEYLAKSDREWLERFGTTAQAATAQVPKAPEREPRRPSAAGRSRGTHSRRSGRT